MKPEDMTDAQVAARTLLGEAGDESFAGQQAVAAVIGNRLVLGRWGDTIKAVCLAPKEFSCWDANHPDYEMLCCIEDDDAELKACAAIMAPVMAGRYPDYTGGAAWYCANDQRLPEWVAGSTFCGEFGNTLFFRNVKRP